ncbi:MAG: hypothetical protein HRU26_04635, partial [Psychroserpens sp.]|nr:hypothetical protein [Psychroserpens sp.]
MPVSELNTALQLQGTLDNEFSPKLNTLSGNALAELMTTKIDPKEGSVLNR